MKVSKPRCFQDDGYLSEHRPVHERVINGDSTVIRTPITDVVITL